MTLLVDDCIVETSTTAGAGPLTLAGAVLGYITAAAAGAVNGSTGYYVIEDVDADGVRTGPWETGLGTWGTGGIWTRTTVHKSSNAGAAVNFSSGGTRRITLGLTAALFATKQDVLVSGTTLKTINGVSQLAAGDTVLPTLGANTFTAAQRGAFVTLTDAATIAIDLSLGNQFQVVLGGNRTLGVPTNMVAGQQGQINPYQDATGSRTLAYAWVYGAVGGGTITALSAVGCTKDMLAYTVDYASSGTFTTTIATPGVMTKNGHGFISGQKCQLSTTGALPTGLAAATTYYVHVIDANTFHLCTSVANAAAGTYIATSGSQSGTHTIVCASVVVQVNKATP